MTKILLITQDPALEKMLVVSLMINGIEVTTVTNFGAVVDVLKNDYSLLLMDGFFAEAALTLREKGFELPIIVLKDEPAKFKGKDIDFVSNPFDFPSLRQKMNNMLKPRSILKEKFIETGSLKIDVPEQLVMIKDTMLKLGKMEFAILVSLARKAGNIVSSEKMRKDLEAQGHFFNQSIFHHIKKLKGILKDAGNEKMDIKLITGVGYQLLVNNQ